MTTRLSQASPGLGGTTGDRGNGFSAHALASAGNVVVEVESYGTSDDLTYAATVLQQQLDALDR